MILEQGKEGLVKATEGLSLKVPEPKVDSLLRAVTNALEGVRPEKVDTLITLLKGFNNPNLSDLRNIAEIKPGQIYNLPGGGTIELTKNGVDIKGPVNLAKLEKFSDGKVGTIEGRFNLKGLASYYGDQDVNGISITRVEGNGFNLNQSETEKLVGGADKLPAPNNAALTIFATQFLPEFQASYRDHMHRRVAVRMSSGDAACADQRSGAIKNWAGYSGGYLGAVALSSEDLSLKVPEPKVASLFSAATSALSSVSPENVDKLTALLTGFSTHPLSYVNDMKEAMKLLEAGALNLPGGGTVELTANGVKIVGPVNLSELEKFSDGTIEGTFNLKALASGYFGEQDLSGISITAVEGSGFNLNQSETEKLVGWALGRSNNLPMGRNAALALFAAQFLPEFQARCNDDIALRTCSGFSVYVQKSVGVGRLRSEVTSPSIGAVALSPDSK